MTLKNLIKTMIQLIVLVPFMICAGAILISVIIIEVIRDGKNG